MKLQIAQLEATLKADVGEKGGILDKLCEEKGLCTFDNYNNNCHQVSVPEANKNTVSLLLTMILISH